MAPHADYPYARAPRLPEGAESVDPREILHSQKPVELEIGPGRGTFILERLEFGGPDVRIFGLEIRRKWATIVDDRIRERGWQARGRVFAEDARLVLDRFPAECLSRVYVHFPDPWWKKRHHKRLLAGPMLADEVARVLCSNGDFFVQTDVEERAELYEQAFSEHPAFSPWGETAAVEDPQFGARSPREKRALQDGLPIFRRRWRRRER